MLAAMDLSKIGLESSAGIDLNFLNRAGDRRIVELESVDFQLRLLAGLPEDDQKVL